MTRILGAVLAGLQILTAGAALGDIIGTQYAAFAVLAVAAVQGGLAFYKAPPEPLDHVAALRAAERLLNRVSPIVLEDPISDGRVSLSDAVRREDERALGAVRAALNEADPTVVAGTGTYKVTNG